MSYEKRKSIRLPIDDATIDFNYDINLFKNCNVANISDNGLLVTNIRKSIKKINTSQCNAVVTFKGDKTIRIKMIPRWYKDEGLSVSCGFEIVENQLNWTTNAPLMRAQYQDVWGNRGEKYLR